LKVIGAKLIPQAKKMIITKGKLARESIKRYSLLQSFLLISPLLAILLIFYLYPLLHLLPDSLFNQGKLTLEHYKHFFESPLYSRILIRTIRISFVVTVICFIVGYPVSYFLVKVKYPKIGNLLLICVLLPFWTSILVRTYSWVVLFQTQGLINTFLMFFHLIKEPLSLMYNEFAVIVGMVHVLLPFMIMPIYSVLRNIDPSLVRASRNLGANPFWAFVKVIFPLSLPGVGAGVMFVFILGLGFYITPAILGGPRTLMISTLIDQQINVALNWEFATAIAAILLISTVIMIVIFNKIVGLDRIYQE
jgi:ABC-type spermidine/putrescine transport system permease subunit I